MLQIPGAKLRPHVIGSGTFLCPSEQQERQYRRVVMKRSVRLLALPAIDIGTVGEHIECSACGATYSLSVLEAEPGAQIPDSVTHGLRHLAVSMVASDDLVTLKERHAIVELLNERAGLDYTLDDLVQDLYALEVHDLDVVLREAAFATNEAGREKILRGAALLTMADGGFSGRESDLLESARKMLGLSRSRSDEIIADAIRPGAS